MKPHPYLINALIGIVAGTSVLFAAIPGTASLQPFQLFAVAPPNCSGSNSTPGCPCDLPDGTKGVIESDNHTCCPSKTKDNTSCLYAKYINPAIALVSAAVGIAVAIAIIVGGVEYITSAGDPQRAASGKKRIVNALIGLIAYALLFTFLQFIIPGGVLNG